MELVGMRDYDTPTLTDLPLELLLIIAEFLSPIDGACLSLSSRKLLGLFSEREKELLKAQPGETWIRKARPVPGGGAWNDERAAFLSRLSRDFPRYFFCYTCSRLHPWEMVGPPGPAFQPRNRIGCQDKMLALTLCDLLEAHEYSTYYSFHFFHVQLAMRGFLYGPRFGISTKSLSYTEVRLSPTPHMTTLLSVEARICPDTSSLRMRVQNMVSVTRANASQLSLGDRFLLGICNHVHWKTVALDGPDLVDLVSHCLEAYRSGATSAPELRRCHYCTTDYKVDIKEHGEESLALVITKWLDLGSGATPDDTRWNCHLPFFFDTSLGAHHLLGDSRSRFENLPGESEEELLSRNLSYLTDGKYKTVMDRLNKTTWFLQAESRVPRSLLSRSLSYGYQAILALFVPENEIPP